MPIILGFQAELLVGSRVRWFSLAVGRVGVEAQVIGYGFETVV